MCGTVKWFNNEKGFGFIESEGYEDIFAHFTEILKEGYKSLKEGDKVHFELEKTEKGLQAKAVNIVEEATV